MIIAVSVQHVDWEDDGGAHDPFVIDTEIALSHMNEEQAKQFTNYLAKCEIEPEQVSEEIADILSKAKVELPAMVDKAVTIWFDYD